MIGAQDLVPGQPVAFFVLIDGPVSRREVPKIAARPCRPGDLLARPLGVAGNTGSGKSCSVARIVQEALRESERNGNPAKAKFIVLDINGECAKAFQIEQTATKELNAVYVNGQRFYLPLRAFSLTEMVAFFEASQASQVPVPERAITEIRENGIDEAPGRALRRIVLQLQLRSITDVHSIPPEVVANLTPLFEQMRQGLNEVRSAAIT